VCVKQTLCEGEGSYTICERHISYSLCVCVRACVCERQTVRERPRQLEPACQRERERQARGGSRAEAEPFQPPLCLEGQLRGLELWWAGTFQVGMGSPETLLARVSDAGES